MLNIDSKINELSKELGRALAEGNIKKAKKLKSEIGQIELYRVNNKLKKILTKLVNENIAKASRKDALLILQNCHHKTVMEFLFFALSGNGNLTCLSLDFAKDKEGKPIMTNSFNKETYD